jgi:hypothetical protein
VDAVKLVSYLDYVGLMTIERTLCNIILDFETVRELEPKKTRIIYRLQSPRVYHSVQSKWLAAAISQTCI